MADKEVARVIGVPNDDCFKPGDRIPREVIIAYQSRLPSA